MQKDVIYIDTEDNITDIIGKVKESEGKVVALVPPKRIGTIQSAVNLKLVQRAAEHAKKHLVVVTNNQALAALAGSAGIPIAKNLQSKPEMPEANVIEAEGEDIIDGSELPVGDHVRVAGGQNDPSDAGGDSDMASEAADVTAAEGVRQRASVGKGALAATAARARTKIPNFDTFRKKLFIGIVAAILLIGFTAWAIVFAPRASIVIKAKTSETALNTKVSAGATLVTDLQAGTIKSETKTTTKDVSIAFTATGKKDIGEKAKGTATVYVDDAAELDIYRNDSTYTLAAGTPLRATNGQTYIADTTVTFEPSNIKSTGGRATVGVTAANSGTASNGATGALSGAGDGFGANMASATAGGTDKTVAVVQQSDVDAVAADVQKSTDAEQAKKDLKSQFGSNYIIIDDTFKADTSAVKPSPAVAQESPDTKGALAGKVVYSVVAISRGEAEKYLNAYFAQQVDGKQDQKVYDNGVGGVSFTTPVAAAKDTYVVTVTTNGKIGPKIDENVVKDFAKGKKSGEIKVYVEAINGVESAEVTFSPFWVTSAPGDTSKIKVQFNLNG